MATAEIEFLRHTAANKVYHCEILKKMGYKMLITI